MSRTTFPREPGVAFSVSHYFVSHSRYLGFQSMIIKCFFEVIYQLITNFVDKMMNYLCMDVIAINVVTS